MCGRAFDLLCNPSCAPARRARERDETHCTVARRHVGCVGVGDVDEMASPIRMCVPRARAHRPPGTAPPCRARRGAVSDEDDPK